MDIVKMSSPTNLKFSSLRLYSREEDGKKIGYFKADIKGEEGELVDELEQELTNEPPTANDESSQDS